MLKDCHWSYLNNNAIVIVLLWKQGGGVGVEGGGIESCGTIWTVSCKTEEVEGEGGSYGNT